MKNGAFVAWLLGWWFIEDINEYLYFLQHGKVLEVTNFHAWFFLVVWIFVGILLYQKKED